MFISMMNSRIPKEWFKNVFGGSAQAFEALIRSHVDLSRFWADRAQDCDNRESMENAVRELCEPYSAPDPYSVRLMTDDEINNLLLAAKVGLNYVSWKGLVSTTVAGIACGDGVVEDGFSDGEEPDGE